MKTAGIIILLLLLTTGGVAQSGNTTLDQLAEQLHTAAKEGSNAVYLKTDKAIYGSGEDLWFSAFVLDAQYFTLSQADKTLYIQLQQKDNDSIVWSEMYPISSGVCAGQVYLSETLPAGEYLLKGYTAHSFLSHQQMFYAAAPVRIVREFAAISRRASPPTLPSPGKEPVQFSLFPEGGRLVAGLQNRVAFKAVNNHGDPVAVNGTLLKNDKVVCRFNSRHAGMGSFLFTPEKQAAYRIRLEEHPDSLYHVPEVQENGVVMQLLKNDQDSLVFKILSNRPGNEKVYLRLQLRGTTQAVAGGIVTDSLIVKITLGEVGQGVAEATLFDEQLRPLAERLVFLHPEKQLQISLQEVRQQYLPREKVTVKVRTTDGSGKPVPAVLSLSVYDQLFSNPRNVRDIVNYYLLSTQLRGKIHDPSYYFDNRHQDRLEALDLLLLAQGWRQYTWNEAVLKENSLQRRVLTDSLPLQVMARGKAGKEKLPASLLFFNYNKTILLPTAPANDGLFYLSPESLTIGPRFFIQYLSEKEYNVGVFNPFTAIARAEQEQRPVYVAEEQVIIPEKTTADTSFLQYGKRLREITVSGKGRSFGDKYLGMLDSLARYEGNTDFVGACGILNCPACGSGAKPVEGVVYSELTPAKRAQVSSHPFPISGTDVNRVTYKYPTYTEEELLKKFRLTVAKGYYQSRQFYEPGFDKEDPVTDIRNVLLWKPIIITDQNGEATITFRCSDIRGRFQGKIEGVDETGSLGAGRFNFSVNSPE
ncbi:hypothetical protein [Chitinophaga arvensicola]|uniref:MG2 domain-containing protein n=1 Tax=Chitinophaga arvensicola TaxID=29529 RepID=A0A1I0R8Y9_9BACT|nr:hypothetical protein [Chitinophaga arvensicola]SEW37204.1 hypothetical protein SAMN04488122_2483 [Chitinophaga arvensicola]